MKSRKTYASTKDWLLDIEWRMGNGQCPQCYGLGPNFEKEYKWTGFNRGPYKENCPLARALEELGGKPKYART